LFTDSWGLHFLLVFCVLERTVEELHSAHFNLLCPFETEPLFVGNWEEWWGIYGVWILHSSAASFEVLRGILCRSSINFVLDHFTVSFVILSATSGGW
jgi:hypothetical protein